MKLYINKNCIGCGICAAACPEVFRMTDEGVAAASDEDIDPVLEEKASAAQEECPVCAIELIIERT